MIRRRIKTLNFLKATKKKRLSSIVPPTSFVPTGRNTDLTNASLLGPRTKCQDISFVIFT